MIGRLNKSIHRPSMIHGCEQLHIYGDVIWLDVVTRLFGIGGPRRVAGLASNDRQQAYPQGNPGE